MNSNTRIAGLMAKLMQGKAIGFATQQAQTGVSARTFQRDLVTIRTALAAEGAGELVAEPGRQWRLVRPGETDRVPLVLAICSVLLGSRALSAQEMNQALTFITARLTPTEAEVVKQWLKQEKADYLPLADATPVVHLLAQVADAIVHRKLLKFVYHRWRHGPDAVHEGQPVVAFFERYYFYVSMYVPSVGDFRLFRLDRFVQVLKEEKGQELFDTERYSLQDHRQHSYLLQMGHLMTFQFQYQHNPSNALDIFPQSKVIRVNDDGTCVIEAYAFAQGAMIWLLGQGPGVKVLTPPSLVQLMKSTLDATAKRYDD